VKDGRKWLVQRLSTQPAQEIPLDRWTVGPLDRWIVGSLS
jgi:hypothetical protein